MGEVGFETTCLLFAALFSRRRLREMLGIVCRRRNAAGHQVGQLRGRGMPWIRHAQVRLGYDGVQHRVRDRHHHSRLPRRKLRRLSLRRRLPAGGFASRNLSFRLGPSCLDWLPSDKLGSKCFSEVCCEARITSARTDSCFCVIQLCSSTTDKIDNFFKKVTIVDQKKITVK